MTVPRPFITFLTPTYRRPVALAACLRSVWEQTAAGDVEHVVLPDHVGVGIGGMYERLRHYADAVHGQYVHILADDDELALPDAVERLREFATREGFPPVVVARAEKGGLTLPIGQPWPPVMGHIDLGCLVTRADVWRDNVTRYGARYEGDFDFAEALALAGHRAAAFPLLLVRGDVRRGVPEVTA